MVFEPLWLDVEEWIGIQVLMGKGWQRLSLEGTFHWIKLRFLLFGLYVLIKEKLLLVYELIVRCCLRSSIQIAWIDSLKNIRQDFRLSQRVLRLLRAFILISTAYTYPSFLWSHHFLNVLSKGRRCFTHNPVMLSFRTTRNHFLVFIIIVHLRIKTV